MKEKLAYKVLWGTMACNGGKLDYKKYLPVGDIPGNWLPKKDPVRLYKHGYHLTLDPGKMRGNRVFLCEYKGVTQRKDHIIVASTIRFLKEITEDICIDPRIFIRIADLAKGEYTNLSGVDLSGVNLSGADLRWVDLSNANLHGADLSGANLSSACLRDADLSQANLEGANLCCAILQKTNFTQAILSSANLTEVGLWKVKLRKANLMKANLTKTSFMETDLTEADLTEAILIDVDFVESDLTKIKMEHTNKERANFIKVKVDNKIITKGKKQN
jgi:uncharacterized protein YjbI with pentapeptide repeats